MKAPLSSITHTTHVCKNGRGGGNRGISLQREEGSRENGKEGRKSNNYEQFCILLDQQTNLGIVYSRHFSPSSWANNLPKRTKCTKWLILENGMRKGRGRKLAEFITVENHPPAAAAVVEMVRERNVVTHPRSCPLWPRSRSREGESLTLFREKKSSFCRALDVRLFTMSPGSELLLSRMNKMQTRNPKRNRKTHQVSTSLKKNDKFRAKRREKRGSSGSRQSCSLVDGV